MSDYDNLIPEFLTECFEHLDGIEAQILLIERSQGDACEKQLNQVFRAAHSIKGGSALFGFKKIQQLSHCLESLLNLLRSKILTVNPDIAEVLLKGFDLLRTLLNSPKDSEEADISAIIQAIEGISTNPKPSPQKASAPSGGQMDLPGSGEAPTLVSVQDLFAEFPDLRTSGQQFKRMSQLGEAVYLVTFDLVEDIELSGKSLKDLVKLTSGMGRVLDAHLDLLNDEAGDDVLKKIPFRAVYATSFPAETIAIAFGIPEDCIQRLDIEFAEGDPSNPASPAAIEVPPQDAPVQVAVAETPEKAIATSAPPLDPGEATIRVKVSLLERLMNLAGELVLSRNQLREALSQSDMRGMQTSGQRISTVTTELQEAIMMTRLQAIDRIFSKVPRMLRELSREMNKEITLVMEGSEVELDKSLIEGLSDPLNHLIRNSIDHGIESNDERLSRGKNVPAKIFLRARHEAGQVLVEVGDDGRGIDLEKVTRKALALGLVQKERVAGLSEADRVAFIFHPGFSTADKVTDISGRGFGMDVVKTNIDRLGGKIEIETKAGAGTLFRIKLPLTLAIIPSLIVGAQQELFAIPQVNVVELLRIPAELVKHRIEVIGGREVLLLRGELLPLVELAGFLDVPKTYVVSDDGDEREDRRQQLADRRSPKTGSEAFFQVSLKSLAKPVRSDGRRSRSSGDITILVVTTGVFSYGIIVNQNIYSEEIVVKPLGKYLKPLQEYSGATILGNGQIALIIDLAGLAARAHLVPITGKERLSAPIESSEVAKESKLVQFLTFPCGGRERYALPLYMVQRIEKIRCERIDRFGSWATIPAGNRVLPVLLLSDLLQAEPLRPEQDAVLIMTEIRGREVAVLGAMQPEVVEIAVHFDASVLRQTGIAGSTIVRGNTLLMIDLWEILQATRPELLEVPEQHPLLVQDLPRVLLIESQGYFRRQIRHILEQGGYAVEEAVSEGEAVQALESASSSFRAVLGDVDQLSGDQFRLPRALRAGRNGAEIPIIALSVHGRESADPLRRNGINSLQIKLDHFGILGCLSQTMAAQQSGFSQ